MKSIFQPAWHASLRLIAATAVACLVAPAASARDTEVQQCPTDKADVTFAKKQIADLESHAGDLQYKGQGSIRYHLQLTALQQGLTAAEYLVAIDCLSNPADGVYTGTLYPKYYVLTVIYAPPGFAAGKAGSFVSTVDYASGSTAGSSFSVGQSVKVSNSSSISSTTKLDSNSTTTNGAGFTMSNEIATTDKVSILKSVKFDMKGLGASTDGIDHDEDTIYLWINPKVDYHYDGFNHTVQWQVGINGNSFEWYPVKVGWLDGHYAIPANVQSALQKCCNLIAADYAAILATDPLTHSTPAENPGRYTDEHLSFPYTPLAQPNDPPWPNSISLSNDQTVSSGSTVTSSLTLNSSTGGSSSNSQGSVSFMNSINITWSQVSAIANSQENTQTASLTISQPSSSYQGATDIGVYWDNVYGTFAFYPLPFSEYFEFGRIADKLEAPLAGQEVDLKIGSQTFRTVTDSHGNYRFPGKMPTKTTQATLRIGSFSQPIRLAAKAKPRILKMRFVRQIAKPVHH